MPELPEVESIVRGIKNKIEGRTIVSAEMIKGRDDVIKYPSSSEYAEEIKGRMIEKMRRRGKYILLELSGGVLSVIHLRMTGRLIFVPGGRADDKYACVIYRLDDGSCLMYADVRRLGTLHLLCGGDLSMVKGLSSLGPEPLSEDFSADYLARIAKGSRSRIKSFLLDQKHIAGLGNIYVDEALAISRIHPLRLAGSLSLSEIEALHEAVNKVIAAGIEDGGTTFRDYRNGTGGKGAHQEHLYVYSRKGKACRFCGAAIEKITVGGRGTYFCPKCQVMKD